MDAGANDRWLPRRRTFMPSAALTGGFRIHFYLDPAEPHHATLKLLFFFLLSSRRHTVVPEFRRTYVALFDAMDAGSRKRARPISAAHQAAFDFLAQCFFGVDLAGSSLGLDGPVGSSSPTPAPPLIQRLADTSPTPHPAPRRHQPHPSAPSCLSGLVHAFFLETDADGDNISSAADDNAVGGRSDRDEGLEDDCSCPDEDRNRAAVEAVRELISPSQAEEPFRFRLASNVLQAAECFAWLRSSTGGSSPLRRAVMSSLRALRYNAGMCKAWWARAGCAE